MKSKKKTTLIGFIILWIATFFVMAEPTEKESDEYYKIKKNEEVVVTATMTPKALKDCSDTLSVVDREKIESVSAGNALDIMGSLPGIFVIKTGDFGRADIDIRGLGQSCTKVAILVDGKPEKMGLFGCAVSHAFPLDNVERIEVVKGPSSALYGGEALGGAVNIITRTPQKPLEIDATTSYGSYNTRELNLKHGAIIKKFKYFVSYDNQKSDGHVKDSAYLGNSFTGKFMFEMTKNTRVSLQGKYFEGLKHEPGTIDQPVLNYWNDYHRGAVDFSLTHEWEKSDFSIQLYRNFGKHRFSDGWDSRDYTNGAMAKFTTHGIENNELTVGGDLRYFGGKSLGYPKGEWKKNEGSVYAHDEYIINTHWIASTGLRLQFDSIYGSELCPHFGIVYQVTDKTLFRAVINKGFRSPQLNELYMFPPSNSNLKPERVWNYELGFEHNITPFMALKGSVFHMKGTGMIQTILNPAGTPRYIFANTGVFKFNGVELELNAAINRFISGNIMYSSLHTGEYTKGRPGQKIDVSLRVNNKHILAALQGQYVTNYYAADFSKNPIPSYFLLNARFIISILKRVDVVADINNILDKYYAIYGEFSGLTAGLYRMPGRNVQVGIRFGL